MVISISIKNGLSKKYELSIIIPTYKEELRIERCIEESLSYFQNNKNIKNFEIIFVADNTGDKTIPIIEHNKKKHQEIKLIVNKHREKKGGSVKIGMLSAKYNIIMFYDVDLSTPLYEVDGFLKYIDKYDILVASRGMKGSKVKKQAFKNLLSLGFSLLKRVLFSIRIQDTQCGFKMFNRNTLVLFEKQTIKSSYFDLEILYLAEKMHFRVKELPVTWIDSDMSNFNWYKLIFEAVRELYAIKKNYITGKYDLKKYLEKNKYKKYK